MGTPIANRNYAEVEPLIGFFVNTLVLRHRLEGDPLYSDLLVRTRKHTLAAYAHQDVPFERLVEALQPERATDHNPLFQVMFVLQNFGLEAPSLPRLEVSMLGGDEVSARFDLTCTMQEAGDRIFGDINYNTDLFLPETIARMVSVFNRLLEEIVADAERPISALPLFDPDEEVTLITSLEEDAVTPDPEETVVSMLASAASEHAAAPALIVGEETLSHEALHTAANRLAHHLRGLGVGPETRVGICMLRQAEMVVAMLAVLKAGGAYVPMDPAYPAERLAFTIEDSEIEVLLTQAAMAREIPGVTVLSCDELDLGNAPASEPAIRIDPASASHVIYTSGSTGRPKGVVISHAATASFLSWQGAVFTDAEMAGVLAGTSICFDLSVFEIFGTLVRGGTVILAESAVELPRLPARDRVTMINTVPSAMKELTRGDAIPASVMAVHLAGESLHGDLVRAVYETETIGSVRNLYGPAESTTYSTWCTIPRDAESEPDIGRPIAHTRVHLLDSHLKPVPPGVAGELCLAGMGLARGYHGRPGLTASRFVPDPEATQAGARIYRTGDLARSRPDGSLQLLGRIDHQVKLRGYRIELGEIESALTDSPAVARAVVIARGDLPGGAALVGYVQLEDEGGGVDLKAHLASRLPAYMVPQHIVTVKALPLTPNGKVDRKRLPKPGLKKRTYTAPTSDLERKISEIWGELLGLEQVGGDDNFFELGGHSLLLVQLQRRLREELEREVAIVDLIANPTPSTQAAHLSPKQDSKPKTRASGKAAGTRRREVSARKRDEWKKRRKKR